MSAAIEMQEATYRNPVYPGNCADPFVLKYLNEYWCYCTGWWHDGQCFGVLHSRDLQNWREIGGALTPFDAAAPCYWAPEVIYENGRFLLYYSVGNEEYMQIRVAEASHPAGPFTDCGVRLTSEDFAIDPHVFVANDRSRYLFYATDFLQHTHIGTGTVCAPMLDAMRLAGTPQAVTRARYDWQVYDPQRASKGGVRWHTVEGPFVLEHKGLYYQMFSGGNWQNATYGASYAISDKIINTSEWEQFSDGERVLPVLRSIPQEINGPGHNSAVRGPDNQQIYCVYHFWQPPDRVMAIDRLDWVGERLTVLGPTIDPQPAPLPATMADFFDSDCEDGIGDNWICVGGHWQCKQGAAVQLSTEAVAEARCILNVPHFSAEVSLRVWQDAVGGVAGVKLFNENGAEIAFQLLHDAAQITEISGPHETARVRSTLPLPAAFAPSAFHLLRVEVNGSYVRFVLDDKVLQWTGKTEARPHGLALFTHRAAAAFAGFALTAGWQDLFDESSISLDDLGWRETAPDQHWLISEKSLRYDGLLTHPAVLVKDCPAENYEFVINAKLISASPSGQGYGFLPALDTNLAGPLLTVKPEGAGWKLCCEENSATRDFVLADDFDPADFQQFRLRKQGTHLFVQHEARLIATINAPLQVKFIGVYTHGVEAAFDMVRVSISKI